MQLTQDRSHLFCSSGHKVVAMYIYNYYVHIHAFQNNHAYEFIEVRSYRIA